MSIPRPVRGRDFRVSGSSQQCPAAEKAIQQTDEVRQDANKGPDRLDTDKGEAKQVRRAATDERDFDTGEHVMQELDLLRFHVRE
jgi:hypothetical protein